MLTVFLGQLLPRGDFEMNFFFEHRDVPEGEVLNYEEGKYKPEEQNLTEATITRDFGSCGLRGEVI